jgi:NTP pyrophosphatase (non-canonical NTP hydrolase)
MTIQEYQNAVKRTVNEKLSDRETKLNFTLGLAGETGEVIDLIKKVEFHSHVVSQDMIKEELGDVMWYLANLCNQYNLCLEDVLENNIDKLKKRYPNGFSSEKSKKRII